MSDEPRFAKGDLNGVMAAYPHVAEWVRDFEMRYGSRPIYYGPLDRDAKKQRPLNLIYVTFANQSSSTFTNHPLTMTVVVPFSGLDWNLNSPKKRKTFAVNLWKHSFRKRPRPRRLPRITNLKTSLVK